MLCFDVLEKSLGAPVIVASHTKKVEYSVSKTIIETLKIAARYPPKRRPTYKGQPERGSSNAGQIRTVCISTHHISLLDYYTVQYSLCFSKHKAQY
jgi:hypothetical protein